MSNLLFSSDAIKVTVFDNLSIPNRNEASLLSDICETTSLKIGDINVNVKSSFHQDKSLYDAIFMITNTRLKETSA